MSHQHRIRESLTIASIGISVAISAANAEDTASTTLKPIIVETSKTGNSADKTAQTEAVTRSDISKWQPTTLNELFSRVPDVSVSGANRTTAQKVYVRGLEETNLNVTIDGAKQTGNVYPHNGNMGIDPMFLKRAEVDAGTGNALSGPGALGGSIRYETVDREDLLLPGHSYGGLVRLQAQTNGKRITPGIAAYGTPNEAIGYLFYLNKSWADDYKDGDGNEVTYTDNEPLNFLGKLRFRPAEGHEIEIINDYRQNNGLRAYQANFGVPWTHKNSQPEDQDLTRRTTSLHYSYDPSDDDLVNLQIRMFDTETKLERDIEDARTSDWTTKGIDIRNRSDIGALKLTYGYDYTWDKSRGTEDSGANLSETSQNHGLYLQADYDFTQNLQLSTGVRYDWASLTDIAGNDYDGSHLSPNIGVTYRPIDDLKLFASWAEAYQSVRPVAGMALLSGIDLSLNDTDLDGTTARTTQFGIEYDDGSWRAGAVGYFTKMKDTILYGAKNGAAYARENGGDVDIKGFTVHAGYTWQQVGVDLSYDHSKLEYDGTPVGPGDWLSGVMPQGDKLIMQVNYNIDQYNLQLGWTSTFVMAEKDLPDSFTALDELPVLVFTRN